MHDELTIVDIRKMQEEIDDRELRLRPKLLEDVKTARAFGDLSENFEYKAAKEAKNKNESRIRYLRRMIATAVIIDPAADSAADTVGLFDRVELFMEDENETETVTFVTTMRQDPRRGLVSKESPVGRAVIGHRVGERVFIHVGEGGYWVRIQAVEKGVDDDTLSINAY